MSGMVETLSVEQVGERLGCSRRRVFQLIADGTLEKAPRYGRSIRILAASVDRALTPRPSKRRAKRSGICGAPFTVADLRAELLA